MLLGYAQIFRGGPHFVGQLRRPPDQLRMLAGPYDTGACLGNPDRVGADIFALSTYTRFLRVEQVHILGFAAAFTPVLGRVNQPAFSSWTILARISSMR